ncbi:MAG: hypothetical protein ACKOCK_09535, partial [Chloroflexota bacterium]
MVARVLEGQALLLGSDYGSRSDPHLYAILTVDGLSCFHDSPNPNSWRNFKTETRNIGSVTDAARLQQLGWQGWEVVGVSPITFGGTQYNTVGGNTVHAAAYGVAPLARPVT